MRQCFARMFLWVPCACVMSPVVREENNSSPGTRVTVAYEIPLGAGVKLRPSEKATAFHH